MTLFRSYLIIIIAIHFPIQLFSQNVFVSYNALNSFDATLHELFYCTLNNTGESKTVYLEARVAKDGKDILIARSGTFLLEEGVTTINSFNAENILQSMSNVSTEFIEDDIYQEILQTGYIPSGNYVFCLIVYNLSNEALSNPDVCNTFISWPISAARLILPNDNAKIETELPLFSWTHAMPYRLSLRYNLQIVELFDGQGPFDAFQSNYLYFTSEDLRLNSLQYPLSAPSLQRCKSYAWRVIGNYNDNQNDYQTRVFKTACDSVIEDESEKRNTPIAPNIFYELNRTVDGLLYTVQGNFKIIVDNPYAKIEKLSYSILDNDNIDIAASNTLFNTVSQNESLFSGKNIFIVDIDRLGLLPNQIYVLKLNNLKRVQYLKFKYEEN
tara:strand:+ start:1234 stop:2385 length:1152 start_codon:yes stop_codon:yes gene_type:complete